MTKRNMKITFYGATQNVTGSKHILETEDGFRVLLDCGFFQGKRKESNLQNSNLPFEAKEIDAVILSHAHLDHAGSLPMLVKNGFEGKIYCTLATKEIVKYILLDSAEIQIQDAKYFNKHTQNSFEKISPIYNKIDVKDTLLKLVPVSYFRDAGFWQELNKNIRFKFLDSGHILGSAITLIELKENGKTKNLVYTGDLGRQESPILKSPEFPGESVDDLIMECTYGNKIHGPIENAEKELTQIVNSAIAKKGKIIVPAFALGRAQELIYILHKLTDKGLIPKIKIFVDSPMAINITELFSGKEKDFDVEWWQDFGKRNEDIFTAENIYYTKKTEESQVINSLKEPLIVISASGMCEGGRVLHHLKNNIGNANNIILLAGYQAENTLGRRLKDGQKVVKIFGEDYHVKAKVLCLDELSAHADQNGLLNYVKNCKDLKNLFLVHGEQDALSVFSQKVKEEFPNLPVNIPASGQSFEI
jgi:metallo-beta-lactamase family protein